MAVYGLCSRPAAGIHTAVVRNKTGKWGGGAEPKHVSFLSEEL